MECQQDLQILDHYGAGYLGSVLEQPDNIISKQIGRTETEWRSWFSRTPHGCVLKYLGAVEAEQSLRLHINKHMGIVLLGVWIDTLKEERPEPFEGTFAKIVASMP